MKEGKKGKENKKHDVKMIQLRIERIVILDKNNCSEALSFS